eukprot:4219538-Amphidinium_carterae.1
MKELKGTLKRMNIRRIQSAKNPCFLLMTFAKHCKTWDSAIFMKRCNKAFCGWPFCSKIGLQA